MIEDKQGNDTEKFKNFVEQKISELCSCIPTRFMYDDIDDKLTDNKNKYDRSYLSARNEIIMSFLNQEEIAVGGYKNYIRAVEERKKQHKILSDLYRDFTKEFERKLKFFEDDIAYHEQHGTGKWIIERLLKSTSLTNKINDLKPATDPYGYIYLIRENHSNYYKIGKTKNIKNRASAFGVTLPFTWEFIAIYYVDKYSSMERNLHSVFEDKHCNGEWFDLHADDLLLFYEIITGRSIEDIMQQCQKAEEAIYQGEGVILKELKDANENAVLSRVDKCTVKDYANKFFNE
jgi:hypothetical protein